MRPRGMLALLVAVFTAWVALPVPAGSASRAATVDSAQHAARVGSPSAVVATRGGIGITPVVTGLDWPAAFTFAPDGRIFYAKRFSGEIRIYDPVTAQDRLFFTVTDLSTDGEQGLLGLALDPGYPSTPFVYAYATRTETGSLRNEILRIKQVQGIGGPMKVIFSSDTVAGTYHDGGRILFGPDGRLYAIVGEAHDSSNSQDLSNNAGKILRMTRDGGVPPNNPFAGSLIFAYGIRNSFGFTFDPITGKLWETEAGPSCNDEINLINKGRNYGWGPSERCGGPEPPPKNTNLDGPDPVLPRAWFTPTITPVGTAFCVGCGIAASEGHLFFGDHNIGDIHEVVLTPERTRIASMSVVANDSLGILSMERGPDGRLYFSDQGGIFQLVGT